MTKQLLEILSIERLKESKVLLDQGCFSGAYYLAGYSLECALKVCIAKQINEHEIPAKSFVNEFYVHDLNRLIKLAGLDKEFADKLRSEPMFAISWNSIKDWNEGARYKTWAESEAKELYNAIENLKGGMLSWIQQYW